jgi:hypothetical protein
MLPMIHRFAAFPTWRRWPDSTSTAKGSLEGARRRRESVRCLSCGDPCSPPRAEEAAFCEECRDRSRLDALSYLYDDLGGGD